MEQLFPEPHAALLQGILLGVESRIPQNIKDRLGVIGQRVGRRGAGLNLLVAAAFGLTLFNPLTLWDVGFQLSAAATMGSILYGDALKVGLQSWLDKRLAPSQAARLANFASDLFLLTLAAQITTLPILAYTFRQVSIISLVANVLILTVQPAVMILGGVALLRGLVWLPLGQVTAWLAYP